LYGSDPVANFVLYELAVQSTHELRVWPGRVRHAAAGRRRAADGGEWWLSW